MASAARNADDQGVGHEHASRIDHRRTDRHRARHRPRLRQEGAKVVVAGRRDEAGKALVTELRFFLGSEAEFINADVRKEMTSALWSTRPSHGSAVSMSRSNNAGTEGKVGPNHGPDRGKLCRDLRHECSRRDPEHEARSARHEGQGSGSIINISSTSGHAEGVLRRETGSASVYVGSKHAVEGITKSVALEIAKSGIRVNGVAPGPTGHRHVDPLYGTSENKAALVTTVPMGRLGLSEELATRSSSSRPTKLHSSPAISSTSTVARAPTDPVRARERSAFSAPALPCIRTGRHRFAGGRSVSAKAPNGRRSSADTSGPCRSAAMSLARPEQDRRHLPAAKNGVSSAMIAKTGAAARQSQSAAPRAAALPSLASSRRRPAGNRPRSSSLSCDEAGRTEKPGDEAPDSHVPATERRLSALRAAAAIRRLARARCGRLALAVLVVAAPPDARLRCAPWAHGPATGTCPRVRPARAHRWNSV